MKFLTGLLLFCVFLPVVFLMVFTPEKCEHEDMGKIFSFQFAGSTAASRYEPYCKNCYEDFNNTRFRGTPDDLSYLDVIKEHSDGNEIVPGEYYIVTAIVTLGDYDYQRTRVNCRVENEDIIVGFSVEFREGFEEIVKSIQKGDEITFRGRFYDEGCGFTDAELILE